MALIEPPQRHPFWSLQCPMRGPGLQHVHESKCTTHDAAQCCECFEDINGYEATLRRMAELAEAGVPPDPDAHLPLPTITGMCMRCRKPVASHPPVVEQIDPPPVIEPKMATGVLAGKRTVFVKGVEHPAPGRGALTPEWIAWALLQVWQS